MHRKKSLHGKVEEPSLQLSQALVVLQTTYMYLKTLTSSWKYNNTQILDLQLKMVHIHVHAYAHKHLNYTLKGNTAAANTHHTLTQT